MNCPDIERLILFATGERADPELETHLQSCPSCRSDCLTIRAFAGVGLESRTISEEGISRIISALPEPDLKRQSSWARGTQLGLMWGLGFLTALAAVTVTGVLGTEGLMPSLLPAFGFGAICVLSEVVGNADFHKGEGGKLGPGAV